MAVLFSDSTPLRTYKLQPPRFIAAGKRDREEGENRNFKCGYQSIFHLSFLSAGTRLFSELIGLLLDYESEILREEVGKEDPERFR